MVCAEYTRGSVPFWEHPMELLGAWVLWSLALVCLETVLVSVQDCCTVCAKRTIGIEIVWDTPDSTPS
jgi:hypothetical protein